MSENVLCVFSTKSFMVSCLVFKSLSHFQFIFVYGVRECSNFIDLYVAVKLSQHHQLKILSFLIVYFYLLCQRLIDCWCVWDSLFCSIDQYVLVCLFVCLFCHGISYLDYCNFEVLCEVWEGYASTFVLFPQDCFGNSGSFMISYNLRVVGSISVKNVMGNLTKIALNLQIALDSMAIVS